MITVKNKTFTINKETAKEFENLCAKNSYAQSKIINRLIKTICKKGINWLELSEK